LANQPVHFYGGQAVIEGVMIRGRDFFSLAVRREDGSIEDLQERLSPLYNGRLRRWPLVRGVLALMETLVLGIKALQLSANIASTSVSEPRGDSQGIPGWMMASTLAFSLIFGIGLFFLLPLGVVRLLEPTVGSGLLSELIEGGLRLAILVGYVAIIGSMREIRRVYAYHGAEHMTVHAFEAGLPLSVDNVRLFGTPHPRCGTAFLLTVVVVSVVVFIGFAVLESSWWWRIASRILLLPIIAAVSYEVIRFSGRHQTAIIGKAIAAPGLWLQRLTTREPDDSQIEVAIRAMETAVAADTTSSA
jgi:uncharacterized protein YqhQ